MGKARSILPVLASGGLLVCAGAAFGVLASSLTTSAIAWRPPARFHYLDAEPELKRVDQPAAGKAWARAAFWGGLRHCPALNDEFVKGCEAEIQALAERPAFPTGPLLVTKIEPVEIEPYSPAEPALLEDRYDPLDVTSTPSSDSSAAALAMEHITASESAPSIPR